MKQNYLLQIREKLNHHIHQHAQSVFQELNFTKVFLWVDTQLEIFPYEVIELFNNAEFKASDSADLVINICRQFINNEISKTVLQKNDSLADWELNILKISETNKIIFNQFSIDKEISCKILIFCADDTIDNNSHKEVLEKINILGLKILSFYTDHCMTKYNEINTVYRKITALIINSLDIKKVLDAVANEIMKYYQIDRIAIVEYKLTDKDILFNIIKEYTSSKEVNKLIDIDFSETISFWKTHCETTNKCLVINDIENCSIPEKIKDRYKKLGMKSILGTTLKNKENSFSGLAISSYNKKRKWLPEEIALLQDISEVIFDAIKNIQMNDYLKKQAEREKSFRKIIGTIRSTLNINDIKKNIVTEIGKYFNLSRCIIIEFNEVLDEYSEYMDDPNGKSLVGCSDYAPYILEYRKYTIETNKEIVIPDILKFTKEQFPDNTKLHEFIIEYKFQSVIEVPFQYAEKTLGFLTLNFKEKIEEFDDEDIKFIKTLASHISYAIHQAHLYSQIEAAGNREKLIRKLGETIRSSLDINETLAIICEEIANILNVDRTSILEITDKENNKGLTVKKDYKKRPNLKSQGDSDSQNIISEFLIDHIISTKKPLIINNVEEFNISEYFRDFYKELEIKSIIYFPILQDNKPWGAISLSTIDSFKHWSEEDLNLLQTIGDQICIAIKQVQLYAMQKQTLESQNALLNNMPFMAWLKDDKGRFLAVNEVFAKNFNTNSESFLAKTDFDFFNSENAKSYNTDDIEIIQTKKKKTSEELIPVNNELRWHETTKSPVFDEFGNVIGTVGLAKDITERKESELELIKRQEQIIKASEKEHSLRNIISTIRSSLDINEVKKRIVTEIGRYFNLSRCLIIEYNENLVLDEFSEFLNDPNSKSMVGENCNLPFLLEYRTYLSQLGTEFLTTDIREFANKKFPENEGLKNFIEEYGFVSVVEVPIRYTDKTLGYLALSFKEKIEEFNDEDIGFIKILANQIAIALHQAQLYKSVKKNIEKEHFLNKITKTLRQTLDLQETLNIICTEVGKLFNVERTTITCFDENKFNNKNERFFVEYRTNENIYGLNEIKNDKTVMDFWANLFFTKGHSLIIDDMNNNVEIPEFVRTKYLNNGIQSQIGIPIKKDNHNWGGVVLSVYNKKRKWTADDISLLHIIADQAYLAISQAEMYTQTKRKAENETTIRNIISLIRSTHNINEIQDTITTEIIKYLNANICIIWDYDEKKDLYINNQLSVDKIKEIYNIDIKYNKPIPKITELSKQKQPLVITNVEKYINENHLHNYDIAKYQKLGMNGLICIGITHMEKYYGFLSLVYTNTIQEVSEEDLSFLEIIADQIGLAKYQAELYKQNKEQAEKELMLRNMISTIKNSLSPNEIKSTIVEQIGTLLEANRCYIREYNPQNNSFSDIDVYSEYVSSGKIKSLIGIDINQFIPEEYVIDKDEFQLCITDEINENNKTNNKLTNLINFFNEYEMKMIAAFPLIYGDKILGKLVICYNDKEKSISEENIEYVKTLANQIGIALHQSKLYINIKEKAEREKMLRNLLSTIRKSMDYNEVLNIICKEIAKLFNVQRIMIVDIKGAIKPNSVLIEYKINDDIKGLLDIFPDNKVLETIKPLKTISMTPIAINNVYTSHYTWKYSDIYENIGVKSLLSAPLKIGEHTWGKVLLAEYNYFRKWTDDEISLLETIADQVSIAIRQANLYTKSELATRLKSQFLANISHEFRTPLNAIIGFSEMLVTDNIDKEGKLTEKEKNFLSNIMISGKHLLKLVNNILDISKIESGNFELDYETFNPSELIKEILEVLGALPSTENITISSELENTTIEADPLRFKQIVLNLINNAIKFSNKDGSVHVKTFSDENNYTVSISDNGIGIDYADREKLFKNFSQIDSSYSRKQEGSGLGLALSKKLIELHNGTIDFESEVGKGSKFWFKIPKVKNY